jgi:hypothetical protein
VLARRATAEVLRPSRIGAAASAWGTLQTKTGVATEHRHTLRSAHPCGMLQVAGANRVMVAFPVAMPWI